MCCHATNQPNDGQGKGRSCYVVAVDTIVRRRMSDQEDDSLVFEAYKDKHGGSSPRPPALGKETTETNEMSETYRGCSAVPQESVCVVAEGKGAECARQYETQGSSGTSPPLTENGTPPYLRWAQSLGDLLSDLDGVELFRRYLRQEKYEEDSLSFWFACEGLKKCASSVNKTESESLMKLIIRKYIKSQASGICKETKQRLLELLASKQTLDHTFFHDAQHEIEEVMKRTTYPNFLKSDIYLQHIQQMQSSAACDSPHQESPECGGRGSLHRSASRQSLEILPTLHEDMELNISQVPRKEEWKPMPKYLEPVPRVKPESQAGHYLYGSSKAPPNPYHVKYSSYLPVSVQDSELQSVSSDARTDDTVSLTDTSSVDYGPVVPTKSQMKKHQKFIKENMMLNKDALPDRSFMPKDPFSRKASQASICAETNPDLFAAELIQRLNKVLKNQEVEERMEEHYNGTDSEGSSQVDHRFNSMSPRLFVTMLKEKLHDSEESGQSILDQHITRVWADNPHDSPSRLPGWSSPPQCARSAVPGSRTYSAPQGKCFSPAGMHGGHSHSQGMRHRKDRETYSSDSGTVHDIVPDEEPLCRHRDVHKHFHYYYHPSSSMKPGMRGDVYPMGMMEHPMPKDMARRNAGAGVAGGSKKTSSSSVMTDCVSSSGFGSGINVPSQERVYNWVLNSEKYVSTSQGPDSEKDSLTQQQHRKSSHSSVSGVPSVPGKTSKKAGKKVPQGTGGIVSSMAVAPASAAGAPSSSSSEEWTVVVYRFSTEPVPYRTKLPGKNITLKQFKTLLRKKGNYRYFFKKDGDEFETDAVLENITDENRELPLWENKIFCTIELVDGSTA